MPPTECDDHSLALPGLLGSVDTNSLAPSLVDVSFVCLSVSNHEAHLCWEDVLPVNVVSTLLALPEAILSWSTLSAQELHVLIMGYLTNVLAKIAPLSDKKIWMKSECATNVFTNFAFRNQHPPDPKSDEHKICTQAEY